MNRGTNNKWKSIISICLIIVMAGSALLPHGTINLKVNAEKNNTKILIIGGTNRSLIAKSKKGSIYTYRSSNPKIASVSANGVVTGRKKGKVNVVRYVTQNKRTKIDKVQSYKVQKFTIAGKKVIYTTGSYQYKTNGTGVHWKVSSKKYATVSKKGKIKAKKAGTITLTAKSGKQSIKKKIKIKKDIIDHIVAAYKQPTAYLGNTLKREDLEVYAVYKSGRKVKISDYEMNKTSFQANGLETITLQYGDFSYTLKIPVAEKKITSLQTSYTGAGLAVGQSVMSQDIGVLAVYNDGSTRQLGAEEYVLSNTVAKEKGTLRVLVTHTQSGIQETVAVPVTMLAIMGVDANYNGVVYKEEGVDVSKIKIVVTYEDGSTGIVDASDIRIGSVEDEDGTVKMVLYYTVDGVEYSTVLSAEKKSVRQNPTGIKITKAITNLKKGESLDLSQIEVVQLYEDGSSEVVTGFSSDYNMADETLGTREVTITYGEFTTVMPVIIEDRKVISLSATNPTVCTFVGEGINGTGVAVTATYDTGESEIVQGFSTDYNTGLGVGTHAVTIFYGGASCTIQVLVEQHLQVSASTAATIVKHPVNVSMNQKDVSCSVIAGSAIVSNINSLNNTITPLSEGAVVVQYTRVSTGETARVSLQASAFKLSYVNTAGGNCAVGDTLRFTTNANAQFRQVMVDENGSVTQSTASSASQTHTFTTRKTGKLTVYATDMITGVTLQRDVNVYKELAISGSSSVVVGKTITLTTTKQQVSWSSSNKAVATVSADGKVKGIKAGTVTITATFPEYGGRTVTKKITVKNS